MANYPTSYDNLSEGHVTGGVIQAATDNLHADAINAIEEELGLDPSGPLTTVAEALQSPPQVRVTKSAVQSLTNNTTTTITWNTESYDSHGLHDNAANTDRLTAPILGLYLVVFKAQFALAAAGTRRHANVLTGGGDTIASQQVFSTANTMAITATGPTRLAAGEYVYAQALQESGGNLDLTASSTFSMVRLGGY